MKRSAPRLLAVILLLTMVPLVRADELDDLARDFWNWRATEMPFSTDDIPRLERPSGWVPDWSPAAVAGYRSELMKFEKRWKGMNTSAWPVSRQVDYRLIGSAIARVRWELEITRGWERNPHFYNDQTLSAYYSLLLPPPPFDAARTRDLLKTLASVPATLDYARKNLKEPVRPFAELAISQLKDIRVVMQKSAADLKPLLDPAAPADLDTALEKAIAAWESYRDWLGQRLSSMAANTAVGHENYVFFLKNVALLPYTPEQLLEIGRDEWARSVAFQTYEEHRNAGLHQLHLFRDIDEQIASQRKSELAVRRYLEDKNILSVPGWVQHYVNVPMPGYLGPLTDIGAGEADDFTSPTRLQENGTRYLDPPSPDLGYFDLATAKDTRPIIVHEGVPGHYFQLVLSWAQPNEIRRHYYDSSANEGLGFYAEEMLLEAGLFDDSPRTREIIYNFARLRALRVEVDVRLALGQFTIAQGAEYLKNTVPMDIRTAQAEAAFFASGPGQAISYQIGKLEIEKFLAEARRRQGDKFDLRAFHDYLWRNGNVPIALQRWEYLGVRDEVDVLDAMPELR
jgi:uncharacterized protein (DUF885 family)